MLTKLTQKEIDYLFYIFNHRFGTAQWKTVDGDTDYDFYRENETLYLYFQWTEQAEDWRNNINFPATPYRDMENKWYAHRGFLKAWKNVEPYVKDLIMDETVKKIIIVGYSHGAAVATLAHEYVWFNRPDLRDTLEGYGFGAPRVYWGPMRKELQERWKNFHPILNKNDIVTHLPPTWLGFRHVGTPIKIDSQTKGWKFWLDAHWWGSYEQGLRNALGE